MAASFHIFVNLIIISTCLFKHIECDPKFPAILIFGDSLVDTGNNNFASFAKANHPPYGMSFPDHVATGRFSDGRLMGDMLAYALGIKEFVPPFLDPNLPAAELKTGVCFASAGSGYDDNTGGMFRSIPFAKQVENFKQYVEALRSTAGLEQANQIISNALVFQVAGSNDFMINFRSRQTLPSNYEDHLHQQIQKFTTALYELGCRNFLVAGIPPLGSSRTYNQKLQQLLPNLQGSLSGSKFVYADLAKPMTELFMNPRRYGVLVPGIPCCGQGCTAFTVACRNPAQYSLWDSIHPTETVYKMMSESLLQNSLTQF